MPLPDLIPSGSSVPIFGGPTDIRSKVNGILTTLKAAFGEVQALADAPGLLRAVRQDGTGSRVELYTGGDNSSKPGLRKITPRTARQLLQLRSESEGAGSPAGELGFVFVVGQNDATLQELEEIAVLTSQGLTLLGKRALVETRTAFIRGSGNGTNPVATTSQPIILSGPALVVTPGRKIRVRLDSELFGTGNVSISVLVDGNPIRTRTMTLQGQGVLPGDVCSLPSGVDPGEHTVTAQIAVTPLDGQANNTAVATLLNSSGYRYALLAEEV